MEEKSSKKYNEERLFLKRRVEILDKRWKAAVKRLDSLQKKYNETNEKYIALSSSRLGRTELFIWKVKAFIKRKLSDNNSHLLEAIKNKKLEKDKENIILKEKERQKNICTSDKVYQMVPEFMNEKVILNDEYKISWEEKFFELRKQICDVNYLTCISKRLEEIPDSNGSKYYNKIPYRIGMIADEFLFETYVDAAEFLYITPENYKFEIDFLIVATAWKGLGGEWKGLGNIAGSDKRARLYEIIDYYKGLGKKIIFYSKEDPSNYLVFLEIAQKCDFIFTTAEECIDHYKEDTGVKNVYLLDFAISPVKFNPIGTQLYNFDEVLFAGTWWNKKYPERKDDMEIIFQNIIKAGKELKLIDRNFSLGKPDYFYPEKYLKYVSPELPHDILQKVHKLYSWSININSIKNSKTMFASRVYELQALGNLIISNHSIGMEEKFPDIIVEDGGGQVIKALQTYSSEEIYEKKINGIRRVMTGETIYDRINFLLECIGEQTVDYTKQVGIIIPDRDSDDLYAMAQEQTWEKRKILRREELNQEVYKQLDVIAFFEKKSEYGRYYIEDMVNAFKYTNCDFITQKSYFSESGLVDGPEHIYVTDFDETGRTVFWRKSYTLEELLDGSNIKSGSGYSIDHFNYKKYN